MGKVIVLGATGQLGAYSTKALHEAGFDVIAVGRKKTDNGFFETIGVPYIGGICLEQPNFKCMANENIDAIVHLAGAMPAHADKAPMQYVQSIIVGMVNVCEWMVKRNIKRIVFNTTPSDILHHFSCGKPVDESASRWFPQNGGDHAAYAIAKNTAVDLLSFYQQEYGLKPCIFRHLTVYGWHPEAYYNYNGIRKILPFRQIIRQCLAGQNIEVWGNPDIQKELLYIKDFTAAIIAAVKNDASGLFNLPGVRPYSLDEQISGIISAFNPSVSKVYCPEKANSPLNLLKAGGAYELLKWQPVWSWESACLDMKEEMKNNPFRLLWGDGEPEDFISTD